MKTIATKKTAMIAVLMLSTALVAGCGKKDVETLPPVAEGTDYGTGETTDPNAGQILPGSQADFVRSVSADHILFDTDRYNIDAQDQATLASQAQWLAQYPNKSVIIEGHCDERGTREYNLALGERRANAAKNYLASLGVDASRIQTVSYGKERPTAFGSNESSWAQNRRAITVTVQ